MEVETEIAILYGIKDGQLGDLVRLPFSKKDQLPLANVVAMAIIDPNNPKKTNRFQQAISLDIYHLIWTDVDCYLGGHTGDFLFCPLIESWTNPTWRFPYILPKNCIEFEGVYVSKEAWQEALVIYADPNGGMF